MDIKKKKNKIVEFWRFIFSMEVVYYHIGNTTALPGSYFVNGGWCVEFFFILSGFLIVYTWTDVTYKEVLINAIRKIGRKIKAFAPMVYFCFFLVFFYRLYLYKYYYDQTEMQLFDYIRSALPEIFFMNGFHGIDNHANGPSWYISTLLICGFFIYILLGILSKINKRIIHIIVYSIITILGYSSYFKYPSSSIVSIYRGFGGLAFGLLLYEIYNFIQYYRKSRLQNIIVTILEIVSIIVTFGILSFNHNISYNKWLIITFGGIILCSFLNQTLLCKFLDNNMSVLLGKLSLGVYLGHMIVIVHFGLAPKFNLLSFTKFSYIIVTTFVLTYATFLIILFDKNFRDSIRTEIKKQRILMSIFISIIWTLLCCYFSIDFFDTGILFTYKYYAYVAALIIILFAVVLLLIKILGKLYLHDKMTIIFLKYFVCFCMCYLIALLFTWPGIWRWDEFWILNGAKYLQFNAYQNYLTSIFYTISLMILPYPAGIVSIQIICCAFMAATVCVRVNYKGRIKAKFHWIVFVPFLLQPTIGSVLYPIRNSIIGFLEIYLYTYIYYEMIKNKKFTTKDMFLVLIIVSILSAWRGEMFFYMLLIPIIICISLIGNGMRKRLATFSIGCLVGGILLISIQSNLEKEAFGDKYKIISMITFIHTEAQGGNLSKDDIENFEPVISLNILKEQGIQAIWDEESGLIKKDYLKEDFKRFQKQYVHLILKYPKDFMTQQLAIMKNANGLGGKYSSPFIEKSYDLYTNEKLNSSQGETIKSIFLNEKFTYPLNEKIRRASIKFLQCVSLESQKNNVLFPILYNSIPSIIILMLITLISLKQKEIFWICIPTVVLLKTILVIVAAPGNAFMYYFSTWLCGYIFLISFTKKLKENENP